MSTWQEKRDAHFANIGNWQQYEDASLEDFTNVLNADPWYAARLAGYANDVANNDYHGMMQYNLEFTPSSGATARGHELTNRYIALMNQGYTNQEIMGAAYGNDGSSWAEWDTAPLAESGEGTGEGGDTTEPSVDLSNYKPMETGTGFLGAYNAKRFGTDPQKPYVVDRDPRNRAADKGPAMLSADPRPFGPQSAGPRPSGPPVTGGPFAPPAGPRPPVTISDPAPRGKFLDSYSAQREELANRPSVMSLFKEMKDYEQPPQ